MEKNIVMPRLRPEMEKGVLCAWLKEEGDTVTAGQTIGAVGDTALLEVGSAPHLHFEVLKNGDPVNPIDYLPAS